jgi:hypothetical protein
MDNPPNWRAEAAAVRLAAFYAFNRLKDGFG